MSTDQNPTARLPRVRMAVRAHSPDAFEKWRWSVSPMFDFDAVDSRARSDFACDIEAFTLGQMGVGFSTMSAARFDRPKRVIARSGLQYFNLMVYIEGSFTLKLRDHEITVNAGDVVIQDMSREFSNLAQDFRNISVSIPRDYLEDLVKDVDNLHGSILRRGEPFHALIYSHLLELVAQSRQITVAQAPLVARATASLAAACFGPSAEGRENAAIGMSVATLQRVRRVIDANLSDPALDPDFLIRTCGLSRASLYRLFEPLGGVARFIRERRLAKIFHDLTDPLKAHERISTISNRWGFTDATVLSRTFRQFYDASPNEIRSHYAAMNAANAQSADPASETDGFDVMRRWLLGRASL